jgi:hypothetical protein
MPWRTQNWVERKSHMRRHPRQPFAGMVQVSWKDPRGLVKSVQAKCLDLSAEGARLETDFPMPARTRVTLYSAKYGGLGAASVRHCQRQGMRYSIGIEFTSSLTLGDAGRRRCLSEIQPQADPG